MPTLDDIVEIKLKNGKTFTAVKLEIPELPGITDKLHLHILHADTFDREILPLSRIDSINGKPLQSAQTEWKVQGSKGNVYTVKLTGSGFKCTCAGFKFKKHCSHCDSIKKL